MSDPQRRPDADDLEATRAYYDEFAGRYDARRGGKEPGGYHDLIDELEVNFVERFARGLDVLEVGCGTGLLLDRIQRFARSAKGVDLSPGMLERARARGLDVEVGSATDLPFPDASFDVACSFKVLPHVREIRRALAEMARVLRPGGVLVAEFYNPFSIRGLVKRFGPAGAISDKTREDAVFTRFDAPNAVPDLLPPGVRPIASRGARLLIPAAAAMRLPGVGALLHKAEWALCDSKLHRFAGFWMLAAKKD
jgi:ubiquinone/menaquinone biosynthesis C-methylase UbiE